MASFLDSAGGRAYLFCAMNRLVFCLAAALVACVGPFAGKKVPPWLAAPPVLKATFSSEEATAQLTWRRGSSAGFLYGEIQRTAGGEFAAIARVESAADTTFTDTGLLANTQYRYRVVNFFGEDETVHELVSTTAAGGFHRRVANWALAEGTAPTRLTISRKGAVFVVGAGAGRVNRFDRSGRALASWVYTDEPLACMETSALDGPALALDDDDHLYVVYNLHRPDQKPEAFWAKFAPDGTRLWTRPLAGLFARHIVINGEAIYIESISQLQLFDPAGERQVQYAIPALLVASLRLWQGRFAALIEPLALRTGDWQAPRLVVYDDPQRASASRALGRDPKSHQDRGNGVLLRPTDFAIDEAADRAFVVNAGHGRIEVFRRGHYLTRWGEEGAGEDQFRFTGRTRVVVDMATGAEDEREVVAGGIARDAEGFIYVADTFNDRIQKFQP